MMMIIFHDLFLLININIYRSKHFFTRKVKLFEVKSFFSFFYSVMFLWSFGSTNFQFANFSKKKYLSTEFCCNLFDKFSVGWSFSKFLLDRSEMSASRSKKFHKILILFMGYNDRTHKNKKCSCVDEISIFLTFANVYFNFFHKTELTRNLFSNYIFWYNTRNYKLD